MFLQQVVELEKSRRSPRKNPALGRLRCFSRLVVTFPVTPIGRVTPISEATSGRRGQGLKTAAGACPSAFQALPVR